MTDEDIAAAVRLVAPYYVWHSLTLQMPFLAHLRSGEGHQAANYLIRFLREAGVEPTVERLIRVESEIRRLAGVDTAADPHTGKKILLERETAVGTHESG